MNHEKDQRKRQIGQLVEETGCDKQLATLLLRFTGGDLEGARRIIQAVPKDIFAIKAKFITEITGYYGAFFFCYDEKLKKVSRFIAVIGDNKEIGKFDITQDWRQFEQLLYEYARNEKVDAEKIEQFKKLLYEGDFIGRLSQLLKFGKPIERDRVTNLLTDELFNLFTDTNIAVKFEISMTDAFALNKSLNDANFEIEEEESFTSGEAEKESGGQGGSRKGQSLIVLKVDPVLSPVRGMEIRELEFGDEIQVRITDEREIADYLAELLKGKIDSMRVPVYTKIVEVKDLGDDMVGVLTQFGPGIMGMFRVPADVKVLTRVIVEESEAEQPVTKKRDLSPLIIVGGIVVVVVLFVVLIALSG